MNKKRIPLLITAIVLALSVTTNFLAARSSISLAQDSQQTSIDNEVAAAAEASTYYQNINNDLNGNALRDQVKNLITSTHKTFTTYSGLADVFKTSDADPNNPGNILWFYTGTSKSFSGFGGSSNGTNREHVWPKNSGNAFPAESGPGADAHHLRPTECNLNSTRGSKSFDELTPGDSGVKVVAEGGSTSYGSGETLCYTNTSFFYPAKGFRGQTARILFYMQARWGDQYSLTFVDSAGSNKTIGKISTLMKWHLEEPVSATEITRNNVVYDIQGNRNPFIDHPEYATKIYANDGGSYNTALQNIIAEYGDGSTLNGNITLSQSSIKLNIGATSQLSVATNPNFESIEWYSEDYSVAKVSSSGVVTALGVGTTNIVAKGEQTRAYCQVTVIDPDAPILIESITLSPSSKDMNIGDTLTITAAFMPVDASDTSVSWSSSNSGVAVIDNNGQVSAVSAGTATIKALANDGSEVFGTCTINVADISGGSGGWTLVKDIDDLHEGDQIVLASNTHAKTAGKLTGEYLNKVDSTFSSNNEIIETLGDDTIIFILSLDDENNSWSFNSEFGLLGVTAVKKLSFSGGTTSWSISIDEETFAATINTETATFGKLQYNSGSPRFTTYTSSQNLPQIYKNEVTAVRESAQEEAYGFVSEFMNATSEECANLDVKLTTWNLLSESFSDLSSEAKDYICNNTTTDNAIKAMIERYTLIINQYGYEAFITNSNNVVLSIAMNKNIVGNNNYIQFVIIGITILVTASLMFVGLKIINKKQK
jgi:endonuclease I